jgi:ribonuclease HI
MELLAAVKALQALKEPCKVAFYSDSSYLVQGMTRWARGWARNGWRRGKKKEPLENDDLWRQLWALKDDHDIEWHWVKGHSGDSLNERADQLATMEIRKYYEAIEKLPQADVEVFLVVSARDGSGFWAASIRQDTEEEMITGSLAQNATSNRLDIIAAAEALSLLPDRSRVSVYSMSDYLRNGASMWIKGWKNRGWQTKSGDPVKNRDEWMDLDRQMRRLEVSWPDIKDDDTLQMAFEDVGRRAQELFEMEQGDGVMYDDGLEEGAGPEMVGGMPVVNVDTGLAGTDGDEWDDDDWSEEGWDDKERY